MVRINRQRIQFDRKQRVNVVATMLETRHVSADFVQDLHVDFNGPHVQIFGVIALGQNLPKRIHNLRKN